MGVDLSLPNAPTAGKPLLWMTSAIPGTQNAGGKAGNLFKYTPEMMSYSEVIWSFREFGRVSVAVIPFFPWSQLSATLKGAGEVALSSFQKAEYWKGQSSKLWQSM